MANQRNEKEGQVQGEPPSTPKQPRTPRTPPQIKKSHGFVGRDGRFLCACEPHEYAKCRTVTKPGRNKSRQFWCCAKEQEDGSQCGFFVWVDDEEETKKWLLAKDGLLDVPEKLLNDDTPWTLSKKPAHKRTLSREVSDESNGESSTRKLGDGFVFADSDDEGDESPSRKAAKRARLLPPGGKTFNDRSGLPPTPQTPENGRERAFKTVPFDSLNTNTYRKGKEKAVESPPVDSLTPSPPNGLEKATRREIITTHRPSLAKEVLKDYPVPTSDLTTKVLILLRNEEVELKEWTLDMIRLEIALELSSHAAKGKTYEETISRLLKRLDMMSNMIEQLKGGSSPIVID